MIISSAKGYKVDFAKTQNCCKKCHNESEHELFSFQRVQLGFIWIPQKNTDWEQREYYLKCPICDQLTGPVNKGFIYVLHSGGNYVVGYSKGGKKTAYAGIHNCQNCNNITNFHLVEK